MRIGVTCEHRTKLGTLFFPCRQHPGQRHARCCAQSYSGSLSVRSLVISREGNTVSLQLTRGHTQLFWINP